MEQGWNSHQPSPHTKQAHIHTLTHTQRHAHPHTYTYTLPQIPTHPYTYTVIYIHSYIHIHICTYTYIHPCTHTHTHSKNPGHIPNSDAHCMCVCVSVGVCVCAHVCVCVCSIVQSCLTLCDPMDYVARQAPLCSWNFPGKNTGVDCHFLLQGIFPRRSSLSRDQTQVSCISCSSRQILYQLYHLGSPPYLYDSSKKCYPLLGFLTASLE